MSDLPKNLTRNQLAEFLPNQRAVRAFEQLLKQVGTGLPADVELIMQLIRETSDGAATADAKAAQALDSLARIADALELFAIKPTVEPLIEPEVVVQQFQVASVDDLADVNKSIAAAGMLLIYDATLKQWRKTTLTNGTNVSITNADGQITIDVTSAAPSGAAGGVLSGTYPNPGFAVDMATQAELDAHANATAAHGATGAVVGTTNSQTLTNKTLTNPTINGFTGDTSIINVGSGQIYKKTNGYVGLGITNPLAILDVRTADAFGMWSWYTGASSGYYPHVFNYGSTTVGSISITSSATAFNTSSDYRLKDVEGGIDDAVERVMKLRPLRGHFKVAPDETIDMFLAHEAQEVVPNAVTGFKDGMQEQPEFDEEGNIIGTRVVPSYQSIDHSKLVPLLTAALQNALTRIEKLELGAQS